MSDRRYQSERRTWTYSIPAEFISHALRGELDMRAFPPEFKIIHAEWNARCNALVLVAESDYFRINDFARSDLHEQAGGILYPKDMYPDDNRCLRYDGRWDKGPFPERPKENVAEAAPEVVFIRTVDEDGKPCLVRDENTGSNQ